MPAAGRGCSLSDYPCLLRWPVPGLGSLILPLCHGDEGNDGERGCSSISSAQQSWRLEEQRAGGHLCPALGGQMAVAHCWHESCASCGASASCLEPELGHLGKLTMPAPASDLNLGPAELFPPEFCVSVPPLLLEKGRLSLTSSLLSCLLCLTPLPLSPHRRCFLHGFPSLSPTLGLPPAPCSLLGAEFITISIMCLVYKARHCLTQALGVNQRRRHPGNCPANPEELFCCLQQ